MIGRRLAHYQILERLGEGGMGVVYKAEDLKLKRPVALKLLAETLCKEPRARARLKREAQAASALNHPHICTIHEIGEAGGHAYIAMEYVEGQTLRTLVAPGGLALETVIRYGTQIADALAHAHERAVVHRDLKSANVVITPEGRAKVLDFGLAKRVLEGDLAEATRSLLSLSEEGAIAGTLAYMAPEVLRSQPADARSDLWALGVVLYEMATGELPFRGQSGFELSSAILRDLPLPLPEHAPAGLRAVIGRCLAKEPGQRYQRASELRAALEAIQHEGIAPRARPRPAPREDRKPSRKRIRALAVLPLENLSRDPEQEYLADGMTEALITDLAKIGTLKVISRTSAMQYRGVRKPLREIARELRVDAVIEGSVFRAGERVRITAQLIEAATDQHLWAESYERDLRDVLVLQSEVARAIAREVQVKLSPQEQALLSRARPVNPEAYEAYLKGRFHFLRFTPQDFDIALECFDLALKRDPNYALAYAGIAVVWHARAYNGLVSPREAYPKTKAAAVKAVELDDTLAEAHHVLGAIRFYSEWDWAAGEREFKRAIELNPNFADAGATYGWSLALIGRPQEARAQIERVLELDPHNPYLRGCLGLIFLVSRQYDDAVAQFLKALKIGGVIPLHFFLGGAYHGKGAYEEALEELKRAFALLGDGEVMEALDRGSGQGGYPAAIRQAAESLAARSKLTYVQPMMIARLYARAGEKDRALEWFEKAYEARDFQLVQLRADPDCDTVRADPRFQDLLQRMKFPQYQETE